MKTIAKRFSSSSAGVLLEKVIENNYEMFLHKTSIRKPFFSKATCISTKKNFSIYFLLENFEKCPVKETKTFRKIINRACFDEYFYRYVLEVDKTCRSCPRQSFSKCSEQKYNSKFSGRYFEFCQRLIRLSCSCLIYFLLFDGIWWKLKDGFFQERLTQPIAAQLGIMKTTIKGVTE